LAALLLLPFVLVNSFFWGFLNYYSGVGLAFLAAAHLYHLGRQGRMGVAGLLIQTGFAVLLFFWHLGAVFIYGVLAGCLILRRLWALRRAGHRWTSCLAGAAVFGLPMLPVVALYLLYSMEAAGASVFVWARPDIKLEMVYLTLFEGYGTAADVVVWALHAAALLAIFGRSLRTPRAGGAALAAGAFLVVYVLMPWQWRATGGVDSRLLPALLVCTLAWLGTLPARWSGVAAALLVASIALRSAGVWHAWQPLDDRLREAARSFEQLEPQARVLPAILTPGVTKEEPEEHFICLAVIDRHAYVPVLFAVPDQQPLRLTGTTRRVGSFGNGVFAIANESDAAGYDYLWVFNPHGAELRLPPGWERTFSGERVSVWRIRPAATPS
jgi:hypothetical protein